jgi:hypothetical protein
MDAVSAVSGSVQAMNQVMQYAAKASTDMADKLVKLSVEMAVGKEAGKGELFDAVA